MITGLQLPFRFDPQLLRSDLARIQPQEWTPHYNERDYGGDWHGVALRSLSGDSRQLLARQDDAATYADTEVLLRSPYFQRVLSAFACPLKSVRLLRLGSGSVIREHADPALGYEEGEIRLHIPIQANSGVEFCLAGEPLCFEEGSCYYVNVSLPHRVSNRGPEDRIHLVIDAEVNDWVQSIFEKGQTIPALPVSSRSIEAFKNAILDDSLLRDALYVKADWREFIDLALQIGRDLGFDVERPDIEAWRRSSSLVRTKSPGPGWVPVSTDFESGLPFAEWVYFGAHCFTEPFFDDSVRAALQNPFARAFRHRAPLHESSGMNPSGFIFHMSRCGSTLISQMLASIPRTIVISEAAPIDTAIQTNNIEWLRRTVRALGQRRTNETHYFIKLDAWHIHNLPLIREAFPETPWAFIYRNPVEVLVSQLDTPGKLALPGAMDPQALGLAINDITMLGREEWCARVLAAFCNSAIDYRSDPKALFIDYSQLPGAVWGPLAKHFSLSLSRDELTRVQRAAEVDAKCPSRSFEFDSERKRRMAPSSAHELAAKRLNPLYSELQKVISHA